MLNALPVPIETIWLFVAASTALAFAPGPDNVFVLTQSALQGRFAGLCVTVGLCIGLLFHTAAVALGVAVIFATSALAFTALKIVGAAYLAYLAWQAFKASNADLSANNGQDLSHSSLLMRGVVMNITNPKVAVFFLAFLPQFTDPLRGALTPQILMLGALFILVTLAAFTSVAWCSGFVGEKLRSSPRAQATLNRIAGLVFICLAVRLATAER